MNTSVTKQRGAVLLVSMIMLLVLTLIGVAGMQTSTFQERMAGNLQDYQLAFEAAEEALRAGEAQLSTQLYMPESSASAAAGQVWTREALDTNVGANWWFDSTVTATWWRSKAMPLASYASLVSSSDSPYVAEQPRYIVEEMGDSRLGEDLSRGTGYVEKDSDLKFHRITTRGVGGRDSTVVMLQSTYAKRYN